MPIPDKVAGTRGCLVCTGKRLDPDRNSFKALYPTLAKEYSSRNTRRSDDIFATYYYSVWWDCPKCKMQWQAKISTRINGEATCPYCDGRKAIPGKTSFKALYPELMIEWDELSNTLLNDADKILPSSSEQVWWRCTKCQKSYQAQVKIKVRDLKRGRNTCQFCKGYRRIKHYFI